MKWIKMYSEYSSHPGNHLIKDTIVFVRVYCQVVGAW